MSRLEQASRVLESRRRQERLARECEAVVLVARNRDKEARRRQPGAVLPVRARRSSVAERREYRLAPSVRHRRQALLDQGGDWEMRGAGTKALAMSGFASRTGVPYQMFDPLGEYEELIMPGAFAASLNNPKLRLVANINHDGLPLARYPDTLQLREIRTGADTGLWSDMQLDGNRGDVRDLASAINSGAVIGMSFAFRVVRQQWSEDYLERTILEVDLNDGDVSFVAASANPWTDGSVSVSNKKPGMPGSVGLTEVESASRPVLARAALALARGRDRDVRRSA